MCVWGGGGGGLLFLYKQRRVAVFNITFRSDILGVGWGTAPGKVMPCIWTLAICRILYNHI